jgi:hypothetical protein
MRSCPIRREYEDYTSCLAATHKENKFSIMIYGMQNSTNENIYNYVAVLIDKQEIL